MKSRKPAAPAYDDVSSENQNDEIYFEEKNEDSKENDDKVLVDFFNNKYLESQEVESNIQSQPSNVINDSMQSHTQDISIHNELMN